MEPSKAWATCTVEKHNSYCPIVFQLVRGIFVPVDVVLV